MRLAGRLHDNPETVLLSAHNLTALRVRANILHRAACLLHHKRGIVRANVLHREPFALVTIREELSEQIFITESACLGDHKRGIVRGNVLHREPLTLFTIKEELSEEMFFTESRQPCSL